MKLEAVMMTLTCKHLQVRPLGRLSLEDKEVRGSRGSAWSTQSQNRKDGREGERTGGKGERWGEEDTGHKEM